eukprot:TRINITY_DN11089_c0_g1_i5.p1 TRINITY_DN11089_c0_g1~~TRINITY_DN11089_c0_g1_i5.p1  ORF type:complete len:296 (-),score=70.35 TRINITY_DN11089_c0_g1_i5:263-1150(-)
MARIRNANRNNTRNNNSSYEEARKQRLQENLKRFQALGIMNISKSLSQVTNSSKKSELSIVKTKSKISLENLELRRSSRERVVIPTYQEVDVDIREYRRSYPKRSSGVGRVPSNEERLHALESAEKLQSNLGSGRPSFVKSMLRSHVSSCFWLGLPTKFCKDYLPPRELQMVLEDQNGSEYDAIYIGSRTGLSGGWRGFALEHGLDEGDALVFELSKPTRFKVYIVKASEFSKEDKKEKILEAKGESTDEPVETQKLIQDGNKSVSQELKQENGSKRRAETQRAVKRGKREQPLI